MDFTRQQQLLAIARGDQPAEIVFRNGNIVNVLSGEIHEGDIAVAQGRIAGIGQYDGDTVVDLNGSYVAPGFIDGHIHIESTMLTVHEFSKAVVPHGTAGAVVDPHEFANVLGLNGIKYVLDAAKEIPMDLFVMASSCVPATPLETSGAAITVDDIAWLLKQEGVAGVAELMNFPGVFLGWDSELTKISLADGKAIDGHSPGLGGKALDAYILAGVTSDHECTSLAEAREKVRRGMHILMREGTAERNLHDLLPLVTPENSRNFSFATDDKHPGDLMDEGHIDHHIREAIAYGVPFITAIQMATINTATHYRLTHHGAIAPGYWANLAVFDNPQNLRVREVYRRGTLVASEGKMITDVRSSMDLDFMKRTMSVAPFTADSFKVNANGTDSMKVIEIVPRQIVTKTVIEPPRVDNGEVVPDTSRDILKLVVIERHHATGNIGVGFVRGFGLKSGALGSTVAHDAHNIIIAGTNDRDIEAAARELIAMNGGQCFVDNGEVVARLALPYAGLVSGEPLAGVRAGVDALAAAAKQRGCILVDPWMTLSFLALSPIPELKVTDLGLVDAVKFELTNLFVP